MTWASLAPLALPDLPEAIGRRLVEEHLLNPSRVPHPGGAALGRRLASPSYEPDGGHGPIRRYWRGPTWVNSAWMVWLGLRRLGYEAEAERLADGRDRRRRPRRPARVLRPARRHAASAPRDFAWSTLICELADPDGARERRAYL